MRGGWGKLSARARAGSEGRGGRGDLQLAEAEVVIIAAVNSVAHVITGGAEATRQGILPGGWQNRGAMLHAHQGTRGRIYTSAKHCLQTVDEELQSGKLMYRLTEVHQADNVEYICPKERKWRISDSFLDCKLFFGRDISMVGRAQRSHEAQGPHHLCP